MTPIIERTLGILVGVTFILLVLLWRGLPVLFFLKLIPAFVIVIAGVLLITAGLTKD